MLSYSPLMSGDDMEPISANTVRHIAIAGFVAALFSTSGAALGADPDMPANCENNLDLCSQKIWAHDSFPHAGITQSIIFSNGMKLTCTSNGANKPRTCGITLARVPPPPPGPTYPPVPANATDVDPANCPNARSRVSPDGKLTSFFRTYQEAHDAAQAELAGGLIYCYFIMVDPKGYFYMSREPG